MTRPLRDFTAAQLDTLPAGSVFQYDTTEFYRFIKQSDGSWAGWSGAIHTRDAFVEMVADGCPRQWVLVDVDPRDTEIARLREALAPFASLPTFHHFNGSDMVTLPIAVGDIRRAKAAIEGAP